MVAIRDSRDDLVFAFRSFWMAIMARSADVSLLSFLIFLSPAGSEVLPLLAQGSACVVRSFCVVLRFNLAELALWNSKGSLR